MSQCQICSASTNLYLCTTHANELRDMLNGLPRWIDHLADVAHKQTRLGNGGGRRTKSDEMPALYAPDTDKSRKTKQARASEQLAEVRTTITHWQKWLCQQHRTDWVTHTDPNFIGPPQPGQFRRYTYPTLDDACYWLAWHTHTLTTQETARDCYNNFAGHIRTITGIINPPDPPRFLGPCPGTIPDPVRGHQVRCNTMLLAKPRAVEVTCPNLKCRTTHNVERLEMQLLNEIDYYRFTRPELAKVLEWLDEPIPKQTISDWIKHRKLKASGYRRPDGRFGLTRHSDEDQPVYRLADVRRLRAEQPRRKATSTMSA